MSTRKQLCKTYEGTLAEFTFDFCKEHGINRLDAMTSHVWLGRVAVDWFSDEVWSNNGTRALQRRVLSAIKYSKKGKELFYDTGRYMNYSGMRGFNKPAIFGLVGTEEEESDFRGDDDY